jgi:hypothetical protein
VRRQTVWFLPRFAAWQKVINESYPGMDSRTVGISNDEQRLVFQLFAPNNPGLYALLDTAKLEIRPIGSRYAGLDAGKLAPAKVIDVKSREGRRTFAYLTLPRQPAANPLPPLVVYVSDLSWSFSPTIQWLTAQGVAVLQPSLTYSDLPVSTLYSGLQPGLGRHGNDVVDAVRAAVAGGQVDGSRVYVIGEQAGASLALHLSFTEPGLFRGVAAINGIYEWHAWLKQLEEWRSSSPGERLLASQIVDRGIPADFPYANVRQVSAPRLFIAAETDRFAVLPKQSKRLAQKRAESGQPVQTYFRDAFFREQFSHPAKTEFFNALLAFLSDQSAASSDK